MYTAFDLEIDFKDIKNYSEYITYGVARIESLKEIEPELENYILSDGIIDGSHLSDNWFKILDSDIFISYSHNDRNLALALTGWLTQTFKLKVFMDEIVWGGADALLKTIDDKYCWQPESKTYNYSKRNLSTSHIHAMLSSAIYSVMDKTEVVIFLNTSNSVPNIESVMGEDTKYTLSPWIYQELTATQVLRVTEWSKYRERTFLEHSQFSDKSSEMKIAYRLPNDNLTKIYASTLDKWKNNYESRNEQPYGNLFSKTFDHPLNYLYDIVLDRENKN